MPKRWITFQEFYPVSALQINDGSLDPAEAREFSEDELADIRRVQGEWIAWQIKITERFGFSAENTGAWLYEIADR